MRSILKRAGIVWIAWAVVSMPGLADDGAGAVASSNAFARTGWNALVKQRFINPPVFTYTPVEGASKYTCTFGTRKGSNPLRMESAQLEFDYDKIWPNCTAYSGEMLLKLGEFLRASAGTQPNK